MSSYVANSFYKQAHDASSYSMHTFGNYGSLSELQQNNYCHEGLDLSGNIAEQASCNSPKREEMSASLCVRTNAPPERPRSHSCSVVGAPNIKISNSHNSNDFELLNQHVQGAMEVTAKPSCKNRGNEIRMETVKNQQNNSIQDSNSKQPQIYPWMTKLHMSHGKVYTISFRDSKNGYHSQSPPHLPACFSFIHSFCSSVALCRPNAGNNKTLARKFL